MASNRDQPELRDANRYLRSKSSDWNIIGEALGINWNFRKGLLAQGITKTNEEKLETILNKWLESRCSPPTWENLIEVLQSIALNDVAETIKNDLGMEAVSRKRKAESKSPNPAKRSLTHSTTGSHKQKAESEPGFSVVESTDDHVIVADSSGDYGISCLRMDRMDRLKAALSLYMHDLDISGANIDPAIALIKSRIEDHIKKSLEDGIAFDIVKDQLDSLMTDGLIPADIFGWCADKFEENKKATKCSDDIKERQSISPEECTPLFCKDVVYHASLCCTILSTASNDNISSSALKAEINKHGHGFKQISVSNEKSMLVAQKDEVIYFAFADQPYVPHGIIDMLYVKNFPLRFITQLLREGKRLVFTGFSFGSLIAREVVIKLWDISLNPAKALSNDVVCILFGPLLYECEMLNFPQLLKTLHSFILKDDAIPNVAYSLESFSTSFSRMLFQNIVTIDTIKRGESTLVDIKKNLREAMKLLEKFHYSFDHVGRYGNIYLLSREEAGSYWKKVDTGNDFFRLSMDYINKLTNDNFSKHTMEFHQLFVQRAFLEKETPYTFPLVDENQGVIPDLPVLIPKLHSVESHCQEHPDGRELILNFIGDNMWFCKEFAIFFQNKEILKITLNAGSVSQKQIQYVHGEIPNHLLKALQDKNEVKIQIHSKFYHNFIETAIVSFKEPDPISVRQSQLARQNPSEIIKLSFLSALLELSPKSQGQSKPSGRFQLIVGFLQEAARIVPLESILFAIASTSPQSTMEKLVAAVVHILKSIPCSKVMRTGYSKALRRVFTGKPITPSYDIEEKVSFLSQAQRWYQMSVDDESLHNYCFRVDHNIDEPIPSSQHSFLKTFMKKPALLPHEQKNPIFEFISISNTIFHEKSSKLICGRNIGEIYPVTYESSVKQQSDALKSLPQILQDARKNLSQLSLDHRHSKRGVGGYSTVNARMLDVVNEIVSNDLEPCVSMLGGFMEQQIRIPLVNNPKDTAEAFVAAETSGSLGVWALFALDRNDIEAILRSSKAQTFVVQIAQFIEGVFNESVKPKAPNFSSYDGKLQFLLQSLSNTVSCSSHYISYTLERELVKLCEKFNINPKCKVQELIRNWDEKFKVTALALVPTSHRDLVARWIIWALKIYQLREELAKYISIGVIGLVNSGKSTLVKKLFKKETVSGTFQSARTTIPFIYNMDNCVEGLGVIDFPGVDDRDESIKGLAKLLVGLAQVVIFVCSYEKFHTASANEWMNAFKNELSSTPVLVCLTHADKLCEDSSDMEFFDAKSQNYGKNSESVRQKFEDELKTIVTDDLPTLCTVKFFTLTQSSYSPLSTEKGKKAMREVGIFTHEDIGEWLQDAIKKHLKQPDLAERLSKFFQQ